MDGSRGPACAAVDRFVAFLRKRVGVPVTLVDEKLSSFAAEEMGKEIEPDFRKRKKFLDSVAAQVILESYFEQVMKSDERGKNVPGSGCFLLLLLLLALALLAWFGLRRLPQGLLSLPGLREKHRGAHRERHAGVGHRQEAAAPGGHRQRRLFHPLLPPVLRRQAN